MQHAVTRVDFAVAQVDRCIMPTTGQVYGSQHNGKLRNFPLSNSDFIFFLNLYVACIQKTFQIGQPVAHCFLSICQILSSLGGTWKIAAINYYHYLNCRFRGFSTSFLFFLTTMRTGPMWFLGFFNVISKMGSLPLIILIVFGIDFFHR